MHSICRTRCASRTRDSLGGRRGSHVGREPISPQGSFDASKRASCTLPVAPTSVLVAIMPHQCYPSRPSRRQKSPQSNAGGVALVPPDNNRLRLGGACRYGTGPNEALFLMPMSDGVDATDVVPMSTQPSCWTRPCCIGGLPAWGVGHNYTSSPAAADRPDDEYLVCALILLTTTTTITTT